MRGPKDTIGRADRSSAGDDDPFELRDRPRRHPGARGRIARAASTARSATSTSEGFSDRAADGPRRPPSRRMSTPAGRKLILDLRGNPGGYVTAARAVASQFIASGPIFWEQDAKGGRDRRPTAIPGGVRDGSGDPLVCLIDRGSASASEIVAGGAPGQRPGDARRAALVRQGHGPAMAGARRRGRGIPVDHREVADAGQALDPQHRHRAGRHRRGAGDAGPGEDPVLDRALDVLGAGERLPIGAAVTRGVTCVRPALTVSLHSRHGSGTVSANERR